MITHGQAIALLRKSIDDAGSIGKWCAANGLYKSDVSNTISGIKTTISPTIMTALGYRKVIMWEKVEKLKEYKMPYCDLPGRGY